MSDAAARPGQATAAPESPGPAAAPAPSSPGRSAGSLRRTLLLLLGLLFALATLALFFGARSYGERAADRSYDHLLQSSALSMADSISVVQNRWQVDLPYAALDLLAMAPEDRAFYRIVAPDGQTITGYGDLPAGPQVPAAAAQGLSPAAPGVVFFDARYRGERLRFVRVPRYIAGGDAAATTGDRLSPVWVQVGQTRLARDALASDIAWRATAAILVLMLAAFLLLGLGVHVALRPIARLQRELHGREASDLRPLASPVPQELVPVVGALNDFMGRLSVNLEALRTFIAEAAHQMRTPLAALIAQAQDGLDDDDPAQQRRSLQAVERNAVKLRRLLNQLLSDASVSHQGHLRRFAAVDLPVLLREAMQDTVPRAEPRPVVRLGWQQPAQPGASPGPAWLFELSPASPDASVPRGAGPRAWVMGDALMLREAFKNLIDNALKYGRPQHGAIDIVIGAAADGRWEVLFADHGPGVAAGERAGLFERFARGAAGRPAPVAGAAGSAGTLATAAPADASPWPAGAGLGLAIVQRVVQSHGGSVRLEDRPDGGSGLVVRLQLPACTAASSPPATPSPASRAHPRRPDRGHEDTHP
ncbi:two-component system sensor histidine kinase TctE [Comamonas sp. BIGb0124]|uniref:sensor histidine kinase n=1 Tax=Comamonas sp. BIGb0124 TaxID=2485130 RepID=UPI000F466659|nr:sensor histidine kinase [Comamonas sp. BIGb0124]ROR17077.1 two-component system sensor histidine kinase TctE [Comamonas sp. BIGb0124]